MSLTPTARSAGAVPFDPLAAMSTTSCTATTFALTDFVVCLIA